MKYEYKPLEPEQTDLVYSASTEADRQNGCVGHLRFDMGSNGREFWSTWWQHQPELQTPEFRDALNKVINDMRSKVGPLYDLNAMTRVCWSSLYDVPLDSDRRTFGCQVDTDRYRFMFRLSPHIGDYSYCYCYDKQAAREQDRPSVLAELKKTAAEVSHEPSSRPHEGRER